MDKKSKKLLKKISITVSEEFYDELKSYAGDREVSEVIKELMTEKLASEKRKKKFAEEFELHKKSVADGTLKKALMEEEKHWEHFKHKDPEAPYYLGDIQITIKDMWGM